MMRHILEPSFKLLPKIGLRLCLIMAIALMVISSSLAVMLVNPVLAKTAPTPSSLPTISAIQSAPSTIGQDVGEEDFTSQAVVAGLTARPTNNIVNTKSFYDVVFITATSGVIKRIQVTFPDGTSVPASANFNEAEGIGPGTVSKSGQTLTYTVTNAVNVPAGTKIRLEFANINNPLSPNSNYKVTVTTRNAANAVIDGPTQSTAYPIKQIGTNAIADGAVTSGKIPFNEITGSKIADFSIANEDLGFGSVTVNNHADVIFASCSVPWGTVLQDGGSTFQCSVPFVELGDHVIATQDNGIPGLTLTLALALADRVHLVVRNYGPTTDFETVRYAIVVYKATT